MEWVVKCLGEEYRVVVRLFQEKVEPLVVCLQMQASLVSIVPDWFVEFGFEEKLGSCGDHDRSHDEVGLVSVSMNECNSMIITLSDRCLNLDGKFVVIGKIVHGMDCFRILEADSVVSTPQQVPSLACIQSCCSVSAESFDLLVQSLRDPLDPWPMHPFDAEGIFLVEDKIQVSNFIRQLGNELYRSRDFSRALFKYNKALKYLQEEFPSPEEESCLEKLRNKIRLNIAAVFIEQKKYKDALVLCKKALISDIMNIEALVRKAKCEFSLGDLEESVQTFKKVLELDPESSKAKRGLAKARHALNTHSKNYFPLSF